VERRRTFLPVCTAVCVLALIAAAPPRQAQRASDPALPVSVAIAAAEGALRDGEQQIAESRYRTAVFHAWMLVGALDTAEGQLTAARDAFARASTSTIEPREALQSLALIHLRLGDARSATDILTRIAAADAKDLYTRRLLAQALVADGQPEEAVLDLQEVHAASPEDLEVAFLLASGYLRLKKVGEAERLFTRIAAARPLPQTYVLIGRTYRDAGEFDRARSALQTAIKKDPKVRRAHYYLGTIAVLEEGAVQLQTAIAEFQKELAIYPEDPVASLRLGMALVEAQQPAAALPRLQAAVATRSPPADAYHYLGRCQLALDRPSDAVKSFRKALELTQGSGVDELRLLGIHYQLAVALRKTGAADEAAKHFEAAERTSARRADTSRERLTRYLADAPESSGATVPVASFMDSVELGASPLSMLGDAERRELRSRLREALARAYLNLGIMQARAGRFARAAELFENASSVAPDFPQVQYSLGVAYFNAGQYKKAAAPLERAFSTNKSDETLRRMLALAWLNTEVYDKAAELLAKDAVRGAEPSLQYAYGLALVRSNRAADAEAIFGRLLAEHGDTAELNVVLGQAHAQQGDYEAAITSFKRALSLKTDVADANAALGLIYLQQGRLTEAADALRAELKSRPGDLKARHTLATVLDLQGQQDEALTEVRAVLKANPDFADARYLLGKMQLARGSVQEAVETLEAAARLAPEEANIHYQLGQAYQKAGRTEQARQQFELFQRLKDKRAGRRP
jgi:tetratricopeptide (TPR) repeat protein